MGIVADGVNRAAPLMRIPLVAITSQVFVPLKYATEHKLSLPAVSILENTLRSIPKRGYPRPVTVDNVH